MSLAHQMLACAAACAVAFAGGWAAHGVKAERDQLQADLAQERGARVLEAQDRRVARSASAGYQADAERIRAVMAQLSQEANNALKTPVPCAPGASSIALGDVPIPADAVDRLRRAGAGVAAPDRAASR